MNQTFLLLLICIMGTSKITSQNYTVKTSGAMKNVMWKGQLQATIIPDTITAKEHLYGIGPVEGLTGEILIVNGTCYLSKALEENKMLVTEDCTKGAPFFVYANVKKWKEVAVPVWVTNLKKLEDFLLPIYEEHNSPICFRVEATAKNANVHIVNLPPGSVVTNPDEAHAGQQNYLVNNSKVTIVGFFSTEHKGIFTHHSSNLHAHLITQDKKCMGHLESIMFAEDTIHLYIPAE